MTEANQARFLRAMERIATALERSADNSDIIIRKQEEQQESLVKAMLTGKETVDELNELNKALRE